MKGAFPACSNFSFMLAFLQRNPLIVGLPVFMAIFCGIFALTYASYQDSQTRAQAALGRELRGIASAVAGGIDGNEFRELFRLNPGVAPEAVLPLRAKDARYISIQSFLRKQIARQAHRDFTEKNLYTFVPDPVDPSTVRWAVMAHSQTFTGEAYPASPEMRSVLSGEMAYAITDLYLSPASNMRWMSAYAPIHDDAGRIVGVVDVALEVERVLESVNASRRQFQFLIWAILVAGLLASVALLAFVVQLERTNRSLADEIAERQKAQAQLLHNAYYDHLTGLPNRHLLLDKIREAGDTPDQRFAVICLELDRFRKINESLGFTVGDDLMRGAAWRIERCLGEHQTLARPTDENFVILSRHKDPQEALMITEHVRSVLTENFRIHDHELYMTASLGVAFGPDPDVKDPETYIRHAEAAKNRARDSGGGRTLVFTEEMQRSALQQVRTAGDLRQAVDRDEFLPHFQPIISLRSRRIVGFEALVRWRHPERGMVSPGEFIPLAEETGLVAEIGQRILDLSLEQLARWQKNGHADLYMSVNFSPVQFRDVHLPRSVEETLDRHGIGRDHFRMEVTESGAMENITGSDRIFQELREAGIPMSIDDFGTGYSSLAYLARLPVQTLKIDRSFLLDREQSGEDGIIRTIVNLAHGMQLKVVAEGVETQDQLSFLGDIACDECQGYLISKPAPAEAIDRMGLDSPLPA